MPITAVVQTVWKQLCSYAAAAPDISAVKLGSSDQDIDTTPQQLLPPAMPLLSHTPTPLASPAAHALSSPPLTSQMLNGDSEDDDVDEGGAVSRAMVEEEKKMEEQALRSEEQRSQMYERERERDMDRGDEVVDLKFKRLQYLLAQSKVYSSILLQKIQQQREAAAALDEKASMATDEPKKGGDHAEKPPLTTKRTTRAAAAAAASAAATSAAAATAAAPTSDSGKEAAEAPPPADAADAEPDRKKMPRRRSERMAKRKSAANGMDISKYFQKDVDAAVAAAAAKPAAEAGAGSISVAAALQEAAHEEAASRAPLGAAHHELRSARQPELMTGGVMRGYQLEGLEWLKSLYENGLNGILADEMGLGKTIQTIAFLAFLRSKRTYGPFLIAAPLSTLDNWVSEFAKWTPDIPVVLYHGTRQEREELRRQQLVNPGQPSFPVVCTSYEVCMNDRKYLANFNWKFIVIDEGHRLKNLNCRLIRELKTYNSANRLLITGTPLQNNLAELWSLLNFLMPDIFDELDAFESWFDFSALKDKEAGHRQILVGERKNQIVSSLHAILKPFLLRRVKADVEAALPKKREYILYAPLTLEQRELYRHICQGDSRAYLEQLVLRQILDGRAAGSPKSDEQHGAGRKRKAANDGVATPTKSVKSSRASTPLSRHGRSRFGKKRVEYREKDDDEYFRDLEQGGSRQDANDVEVDPEEAEMAKAIAMAKREVAAKKLQNPVMQLRLACDSPHNFYWPWRDGRTPDARLVRASGKMLLLERLLPALLARGHKVLVFSQFASQLDILEAWACELHGWRVCRLDGAVGAEARRTAIATFRNDAACQLFLLSTRAGGQGINLAAADTVVLFDSDWNPQQDVQAQDRAHRIGQTRPVIVYRLATRGTVEQALLDRAEGKRRLEKVVIQHGQFRSLVAPPPPPPLSASDAVTADIAAAAAAAAGAGEDGKSGGVSVAGKLSTEEHLLRMLLQEDFETYDAGGGGADGDGSDKRAGGNGRRRRRRPETEVLEPAALLSDADLEVLLDRSDEAYQRASNALQLQQERLQLQQQQEQANNATANGVNGAHVATTPNGVDSAEVVATDEDDDNGGGALLEKKPRVNGRYTRDGSRSPKKAFRVINSSRLLKA